MRHFGFFSPSLKKQFHIGKPPTNLHIAQVLSAPMSFFYNNPVDKIITRFDKDIDVQDNAIPASLKCLLRTLAMIIQVLFIISRFSTPTFLPLFVSFAIIYFCIHRFSLPTHRRLKRFENASKSLPLHHLSQSTNISGI